MRIRPHHLRSMFAPAGLAVVWLAGCLLSPQPDPPGDNVVVSAAAGDDDVVAVAGGNGAVPAGAGVRVDDANNGESGDGTASADGSFVLVVPSSPGHRLFVTYEVWRDGGWVESAAREFVVDRYDPPVSPSENDDAMSPWQPGTRVDAAGGFVSDLAVDAPVAGLARVWCPDGCIEPGVRVVVADQDRATVTEATYLSGPFEVRVAASVGDELLAFAVLADNPQQTSRVVRLVVPAP